MRSYKKIKAVSVFSVANFLVDVKYFSSAGVEVFGVIRCVSFCNGATAES